MQAQTIYLDHATTTPLDERVLLALGLSHEWGLGLLRLTFGRSNTREHILRLLELLPTIVEKLGALAPSKL